MHHPLVTQIDKIRRQLTWLVWLRSIGIAASVVLASWMILGSADWMLRREWWLLRSSFFALLCITWAVVIWRWLVPAIRYRPTRLEMARRIESQVETLRDRVSTSLNLLERATSNAESDSPVIRKSVIDRATSDLLKLRLASFVHYSRVAVPIVICGLLAAATIGIYWASPETVELCFRRSVAPWNSTAWPKKNHIRFETLPDAVARGETITVYAFDDNDRLESGITLDLETTDNGRFRSFAMRPLAGTPGKFRFRLENIQRNFRIRASGGDSRTDWHDVELIDAPRVQNIKVTIIPPASTELSATESSGPILAWPGSLVEIHGQSDKPLTRATVHYGMENGRQVRVFDARIDSQSNRFFLPATENGFVCQQSGWFWITLTDREIPFHQTPTRWQVDVVKDLPPRITIETVSDELGVEFDGSIGVNSQFGLPISVIDELAISIATAQLTGAISDRRQIPLGDMTGEDADNPFVRKHRGHLQFQSQHWNNLKAGDRITITVAASDVDGQLGQSEPLHLNIVSESTLLSRLYQKQSRLIQSLQETIELHRQALSLVDREIQRATLPTGTVPAGRANLRRVQSLEQEILSRFVETPTSLVSGARHLLRFARIHALNWPGQQGAQQSLTLLERVQNEFGPALRTRLQRLERQPDSAMVIRQNADLLISLQQDQNRILETMELALAAVKVTNDLHRLAANFREVRDQQVQLARRVRRLGIQLLDNPADIDPDLDSIHSDQQQIRRAVEQLSNQLSVIAGEKRPDDSARGIIAAQNLMAESGIFALLSNVESSIKQRRLGQANETQRQVAKILEEVAESMYPTGRSNLEQLDRRLAMRQSMDDVTGRVDLIRQQLAAFLERHGAMTGRQHQSERQAIDQDKRGAIAEMRDLYTQIDPDHFAASAKLLKQAADVFAQSPSPQDPDGLRAEIEQIDKVLHLLNLARQELVTPTKNAKPEINLDEQLDHVMRIINGLRQVLTWMTDIDQRPETAQPATTDRVVQQQQQLRNQFVQLTGHLGDQPIVHWLAGNIEAAMDQSLDNLRENRFGSAAQSKLQEAIDLLQQLANAISAQIEIAKNVPQRLPADSQETKTPEASISSFELVLLYVMQQQLRDDAETWIAQRGSVGELTDALASELRTINQRQQKLAELTQEILGRSEAAAATKPLPELPEIPDF